jgi:hypothetical protein
MCPFGNSTIKKIIEYQMKQLMNSPLNEHYAGTIVEYSLLLKILTTLHVWY